MAHQCGVSPSWFSRMFTTWVNFLAYQLSAMHKFPSSSPRIVHKAFMKFPYTRVVIDCTEVYTKRPSGLQARKQLFSQYKHHNTVKFLVGISPLCVSNCWGGRASDKKITMESGLLDKLNAGQDVMADRGFDISVHLETVGMELHIPSFLAPNACT